MKVVLIITLMISVACMIGCGPKKVRPLDEEAEEAKRRAAERVKEEDEERRIKEKPVSPIEMEDVEEVTLGHINFEYDKYNLTDDATTVLSRNAALLMDNPAITVLIEGHCDERGTEEYNLALGEKRALASRDFLTRFGIAKERLSIVTYGEERPLDPGHDEAAWAKNRRAVFVVR